MTLHPQVAALAAQLEDLSVFLRMQGDRLWSARVELCRHLVADSNFAGVERFLRLFEGEDNLGNLAWADAAATARLRDLVKAARTLADRLVREEGVD
ncbi:MAG TPA: hypothetical protein VJM79_01485 [Rhizorhapis sp.]|nr:hypothetical protein [Sphingobium sp.]HKX35322.1 hypothetical protein [Rhizorhapis sp.]